MFRPHARCSIWLLSVFALTALAQSAPVKLAAPGLTAEGLEPAVTTFLSDHLSQQLAHRGLEVLTASQIRTLMGLERQRQLMGCGEEEGCVLELANALGVDGVVSGVITRQGTAFQLAVEVRGADGKVLASDRRQAPDEDALLPTLSAVAAQLAEKTLAELGRTPAGPQGSDEKFQKPVKEYPRNLLSLSPLGVIGGFWGIEYERALGAHLSVFAAPQLILPYFSQRTALELTLGMRVYPFGEGPSGVHAGAFLLGGLGYGVSLEEPIVPLEGPAAAVGVQAGYNAFITDHFVVSGGLGILLNFTQGYLSPGPTTPLAAQLVARINLGWAF